jgi:hypothetical protein
MLSLHQEPGRASGSIGRLLAALILIIAGPMLLLHGLLRRSQGRTPDWVRRSVIRGGDRHGGALDTVLLRLPPPEASPAVRRWSRLAGLMDVATGRRAWFGVHPRSASQWYAIRPEWQQLLARQPIGLFHAPAWSDDRALLAEASAAADIFAITQGPLRRAGLLLQAIVGPLRSRRPT